MQWGDCGKSSGVNIACAGNRCCTIPGRNPDCGTGRLGSGPWKYRRLRTALKLSLDPCNLPVVIPVPAAVVTTPVPERVTGNFFEPFVILAL